MMKFEPINDWERQWKVRSFRQSDKERLIELYNKGLNDNQIGKEMPFEVGTVREHRRKLGLPPQPMKNYMKPEIKNLTKIEYAYIAGLLDADGNFTLTKDKNNCYHPSIHFTNTSEKIIEPMKKWFSNYYYHERNRDVKWKTIHSFTICRLADVPKFIEQILPFLIIKKEQAELLKEYCETRLSKPNGIVTDKSYDEIIYQKMKRLNRRGPIK